TKTEDAEREQTPVLYHGGKFPRTIHSHRTSRTANEVRQCLSEASLCNQVSNCYAYQSKYSLVWRFTKALKPITNANTSTLPKQ
ncbi:hypothetical protein M2G65_22335, partial [Vibrio vulnificus]|nr:hypothetical protein [Vibrio vulnificus]